MRLLGCGSRDWVDYEAIFEVVAGYFGVDPSLTCAHGAARGADRLFGIACLDMGIHVHEYPAQWDLFGLAAGPIRNQRMLEDFRPDLVVAFSDHLESSAGTRHMTEISRRAGIPTRLIRHNPGG